MKYYIALVVFLLVLAVLRWCFLPHGRLPRFRVRYMRIRLRLRLHPGRGHASFFELWLRWGRLAAFRRSSRARPSAPAWERLLRPGLHSVFLGRAHYRHGLRTPVEEHVVIMAPPRKGRTGLLAKLILHYPVWVPRTCATWADALQIVVGSVPRPGAGRAGPGPSGGVMIFGLWA